MKADDAYKSKGIAAEFFASILKHHFLRILVISGSPRFIRAFHKSLVFSQSILVE